MMIASKPSPSKQLFKSALIHVGGTLTVIAAVLLTSIPAELSAQSSGMRSPSHPHYLVRGDMAPGVAADMARMTDQRLNGHVQPVRMVGPIGSRLQVRSQQGYTATHSSRVSVGLKVGPVYRFKVTNIPRHTGKELYPSVEVLNKLSPPKGLENEFPIQVVMTQDDLEEALQGRLVTKVIYLENPEISLPHRHQEDKQPFFDIGGGQDPLRAAEKMGRPMAILRIGSRIPMASDRGQEFEFHAPAPSLLPDPQTMRAQENVDDIPNRVPQANTPSVPEKIAPIPNGQR
ncbi:MAG: hypothetical protein P8J27_01380 [Mariniblastus sp.]|nr:hypothetical protein [Mariniblastus sp.]